MNRSPVRGAIQAGVFLLLYIVFVFVCIAAFHWAFGYFAGLTLGQFAATTAATALAMKIFVDRPFADVGYWWNGSAARNFLLGVAGGGGSAALVIGTAFLFHWAHFEPSTGSGANWRTAVFFPALIFAGAAGEEILFHGFAFQTLYRELGPWATILPVGVLFGLLHNENPNPTNLSLINTAIFGTLFGLAFLRSKDLWLPTGLHFGWNVVLPLLGANLSGLRIEPTGFTLVWTASDRISGGNYGPEASLLTTAVLLPLLVYILKAPVQQQPAGLSELSLASWLLPEPAGPEQGHLAPKTEWNSSADSQANTPPSRISSRDPNAH